MLLCNGEKWSPGAQNNAISCAYFLDVSTGRRWTEDVTSSAGLTEDVSRRHGALRVFGAITGAPLLLSDAGGPVERCQVFGTTFLWSPEFTKDKSAAQTPQTQFFRTHFRQSVFLVE